ncbi:MAG: hypothetical protein IKT46_07360 [Clostridia bacterium]|nr:hypothetical protein [Clostridia bacterium]
MKKIIFTLLTLLLIFNLCMIPLSAEGIAVPTDKSAIITPQEADGLSQDIGDVLDDGEGDEAGFNVVTSLLISLVVGLIVSFIATSIMKGQLKSVRKKDTASDYLKKGSFKVTHSRDIFLYKRVTAVKKAKPPAPSGKN